MKIVPTILALTIFLPSLAQNACDESLVLSVSNTNFKPLPFQPRAVYTNVGTGKYYGCGPVQCGLYCDLVITKSNYDENSCELSLEGYYYFRSFTNKQQPFDFSIFLAEPRKNENGPFLSNVRMVAEIPAKEYDNGNISSSYGEGFFRIKFSFTASDRLYFDAGQHIYLTEYDVGCLLQRAEYKKLYVVRRSG